MGLPKAYNSQEYEDNIYSRWEKSGLFNPDVCVEKGICKKSAETFTIVLPPPNITDKLHLGHVVMVAVSDVLIRYNRMRGKRTLWLPGTDHAAIATQNVVEKKIWREQKKTRHDLRREKFLEEVYKFIKETQTTIIHQLKKTGASLDWSREAFTLDEQRQKAVKRMFVDMYNEGIIYRGQRIVNWCPRCRSTLADDEVEYKEAKARIYVFKYDKDFPISIATTRPETKLGDAAVAVNPKDERYKKYIGRNFKVNFCGQNLEIKIIGDREVDMEYGTGAVGVTPAHSKIDYEMARKNDLEVKKIIDESGRMVNVGKFNGLAVAEAREMAVAELKEKNLLEKEKEIENNLSICYRCNTAIEPLPSEQWFVAVDKKLDRLGGRSLKEKAIEAAGKNKIKFAPERFAKRYLDWVENLHDWCISRQIWFGHQIPAYYKNNEIYVGMEKPKGAGWKQDEDVLDTWFSSGMWTFSALGWPDKTKDLKTYHPTQVLETGYEIITLWVSRMVMMSLFATGEIPFENVYLHGMVLDRHGKKMSKSKGTGIDPLEMIEKYGTDAVRMSLIAGNTPGNDMRMSEQKIADFRNFANKLWNITRFVLMTVGEKTLVPKKDIKNTTLADKWILIKLQNLFKEITQDIEYFQFSQAGEKLRDFTWNDFADWYIEISKFEGNKEKNSILFYITESLLKLWHPFMPFVTEALWRELGNKDLLMAAKWPEQKDLNIAGITLGENIGSDFDLVRDVIKAIRNLRAENGVKPKEKVKAVIYAGNKVELIKSQAELIKSLRTGVEELKVENNKDKIEDGKQFKVIIERE